MRKSACSWADHRSSLFSRDVRPTSGRPRRDNRRARVLPASQAIEFPSLSSLWRKAIGTAAARQDSQSRLAGDDIALAWMISSRNPAILGLCELIWSKGDQSEPERTANGRPVELLPEPKYRVCNRLPLMLPYSMSSNRSQASGYYPGGSGTLAWGQRVA